MDIWDIYNKYGQKTGRTVRKGTNLKPGEFHIVVEVWIRTSPGHYIIQKRSPNKKLFGGMWTCSVTGSILKGETPKEGLVREIREELGLEVNKRDLVYWRQLREERTIFYIYHLDYPATLPDMTLQSSEVADVRIVPIKEIRRMVKDGSFVRLRYYQEFFEFFKRRPWP